jgi:stearoyl-CoA desaturase (delta-9 desaturase)
MEARAPLSPVHVVRIGALHLVAIVGIVTYGVSLAALAVCLAGYAVRFFGVSGGYHRYFSHRSFRTSRAFQFLLGLLGASSGQKGPLSWVTSHRLHHQRADREGDPHSPGRLGFVEAYIGWVMRKGSLPTDERLVRDFEPYPEIFWLNRWHNVGPLLYLLVVLAIALWIPARRPEWNASAGQIVVWGFLVSTILSSHASMVVNTLSHLFGSRRFDTPDESRNLWWLSPWVLGEGWHNNHHARPTSATVAVRWWEFDPTYWTLKGLEKLGLVWDLR